MIATDWRHRLAPYTRLSRRPSTTPVVMTDGFVDRCTTLYDIIRQWLDPY